MLVGPPPLASYTSMIGKELVVLTVVWTFDGKITNQPEIRSERTT